MKIKILKNCALGLNVYYEGEIRSAPGTCPVEDLQYLIFNDCAVEIEEKKEAVKEEVKPEVKRGKK